MSPKRWTEISHTNEEKFFFLALTLNSEKEWRSADGLALELGWPVEKVTSFIDRFAQLGVVVPHPNNPKLWGYWETVKK